MSGFLTRLEELDKAATPGQWFDSPRLAAPGQRTIRQQGSSRPITRMTENEAAAAEAYGGSTEADADLIVHLRNHIPEIIALVKEARKYRDHLNSPYPHTRLLAALEALDK